MMGRAAQRAAGGAAPAQGAQAHGRGTHSEPPNTGHSPDTMRNRLQPTPQYIITCSALLVATRTQIDLVFSLDYAKEKKGYVFGSPCMDVCVYMCV